MPLPAIDKLSDDDVSHEPIPAPKSGVKSPTEKATEPKSKSKPKAKAKTEQKPKTAAKKAAAKSKQEQPTKTEPKETESKKRPAAAPKAVMKRPSVATARAYKYMYHKQSKWGIKFGGHEILTVWPS